MGELWRIVPGFLANKATHTGLTSFRVDWCDRHQLSLILLLRSWRVGPRIAWSSVVITTIIVGGSLSVIQVLIAVMDVLGSAVISSGLTLATPSVSTPAVVVTPTGIGLIPTSAVVITVVVVIPIVVVVVLVVVILAVVVAPMVVVTPPIVFIAHVIIFVAVVIFLVAVVGERPVALSVAWSVACLSSGQLWFDIPY